jgi:hypothetical protein
MTRFVNGVLSDADHARVREDFLRIVGEVVEAASSRFLLWARGWKPRLLSVCWLGMTKEKRLTSRFFALGTRLVSRVYF